MGIISTAVARMRSTSAGPGGAGGGALIPAFQNKIPQWSNWSTRKAVDEGFKSSVWVYICVQRLMKAVSSVPWVAFERHGKEWEGNPDSPLTQLVEHPNPFMGRQKLIEWVIAHLSLAGNSLLTKIVARRIPVELWPIWDLDKIQVVPSRERFIERYDFRRDGSPIPLDPSEVVHLMYPDPSNPFWGLSPLQAAARVVDTDIEAVRWNKVMLQNRAVGDGVFAIKGLVTADQFDDARAMIRDQYAGADNARLPWVMSEATYQPMSRTPVEMDWLESRKVNRQEIAAVFGVPLPMVGDYSDATLANIETARKIFWADTVVPILDDIKAVFNMALTPAFGERGTLELRYDTSNVEALQEDLTAKIQQLDTMVQRGIPINVAIQRLKLGIDPIPGGDVPLVASTLVPLSMAGESDPKADPPPKL